MPKWEARIGESRAPVRYLSRFKRFRLSRNFHEKWMPKWLPKLMKIGALDAFGPFFMILGGFWRCSIFNVFGAGKKSAQNRAKNSNFSEITKSACAKDPRSHRFGPGQTPGRGLGKGNSSDSWKRITLNHPCPLPEGWWDSMSKVGRVAYLFFTRSAFDS